MDRLSFNSVKKFSLLVGITWITACCVGSHPESPLSTLTEEEQIIVDVEQGSYKTTFLLTDAPSDNFKSVKVDIKSPIVITQEGNTVNVPLPDNLPIRVDLLELDEVSETLASAEIPAGTISRIRLDLANPEIVLLDDTVVDASTIEFSPVLEITPATTTPVTVPSDRTGIAVLLDFDVEDSIKIDIGGSGRPLFRPKGGATPVDKKEGVEASRVRGTVTRIPAIQGNPTSFSLKPYLRDFPVHVNASEATIYERETTASSTFAVLKEGQQVEARGFFTYRGILKAKRVVILPEGQKEIRGIITALNSTSEPHTFELRFFHQQDRESTSTDKVTVFYNLDVHILQPPDRLLIPSDLTNGQMVMVRGSPTGTGLQARAIVVEPERFRGFIAAAPNCMTETEGLIQVIYPFKEVDRLLRAGIDLRPHNSGIVEISKETRLFGLSDTPISCAKLRQGMSVKIMGRMIPHLSTDIGLSHFRIKGLMVKVIPVPHVGGTVRDVLVDIHRRTVLTLDVPLDKVEGFDRLAPVECFAYPCDRFTVKVVLSERVYNPGGIVFDKTLVSQNILTAGYFMTKPEVGDTVFFFAVVIRKGEPQKESISPLADVMLTDSISR